MKNNMTKGRAKVRVQGQDLEFLWHLKKEVNVFFLKSRPIKIDVTKVRYTWKEFFS